MKASTITLERSGQIGILQGMIHIAPPRFYQHIQKDLDHLIEKDYMIFYELVNKHQEEWIPTSHQLKIREFFQKGRELFDGMDFLTGQLKSITYPEHACNADIDEKELLTRLEKNHLLFGVLLDLINLIVFLATEEERHELLKEALLKEDDSLKEENGIGETLLKIADDTLIIYRNEVAFRIVQEGIGDKNFLLHYGEGHIPHLIELFEKEGWSVTRTYQVSLFNFL